MRQRIGIGIAVALQACTVSEDGASTFGPAGSAGPMSAGGSEGDDGGTTGDDGGTTGSGATGDDDAMPSSGDGDPGDTGMPVCGDGVAADGEVCDGSDFAGDSCEAHGYTGGMLGCAPSCSAVDLSGCTMRGPSCGNGTIDAGEQCDGAALGGTTCAGLGFDMGVVSCTATCSFDTTGCADVACAEMFEDCSSMPCCADLFCYPVEGNYCGPTP